MLTAFLVLMLCMERINAGSITTVCYDDGLCFNTADSYCGIKELPYKPDKIDTKFRLFNRKTGRRGQEIDFREDIDDSDFMSRRQTVFLIHGFLSSAEIEWIIDLKEVLTKETDGWINIVTVDWNKGAEMPKQYPLAARNTQVVGNEIAKLIIALKKETGTSYNKFHLIGFSLGAHVAGFAGKRIRFKTGGKVSRITGLDPAGPCFETSPSSLRLDKGDADFVDVIHTGCNSFGGGIRKSVGDVDFYPHGCGIQPGCLFDFTGCNHRRAYQLFIDSIENKESPLSGSKCRSYRYFERGICSCKGCAKLGYNTDRGSTGVYYLKTASRAPFAGQTRSSVSYW